MYINLDLFVLLFEYHGMFLGMKLSHEHYGEHYGSEAFAIAAQQLD
jgi:hypothetical protein